MAAISDKQFEKGEAALLKGAELDPSNIRIRLALANYYRDGLYKDSNKEWKHLSKAYEVAPTDKYILKDVVSYHLRFNGVDKAAQFINDALTKNPEDYATKLIAGFFNMNQGSLEKALGLFTEAIKVTSEGEERMGALFAKGQVETSLKRYTEANNTYQVLMHDFPESEWGYQGLVVVTTFLEGPEKATQALEEIAEKSTQSAPYVVLIKGALQNRNISGAKTYLQKIKAIDSEEEIIELLEFTIDFANAFNAVSLNKFEEARKLIAPILVSQPDNLKVLSFLVDLELRAGQLNEANKVLDQLESLNPNSPTIPLFRGEIALKNEDMKTAKQQFTKAWIS